jgi:hypothetical protein
VPTPHHGKSTHLNPLRLLFVVYFSTHPALVLHFLSCCCSDRREGYRRMQCEGKIGDESPTAQGISKQCSVSIIRLACSPACVAFRPVLPSRLSEVRSTCLSAALTALASPPASSFLFACCIRPLFGRILSIQQEENTAVSGRHGLHPHGFGPP